MQSFLPTPPLPVSPCLAHRFAPPLCNASRQPLSSSEPLDDSVLVDDTSGEQYLQMLLSAKPSLADLLPKTPAPNKAPKPSPRRRTPRVKKRQAFPSQLQTLAKGVQVGDGANNGALSGTGTDLDIRLARAPNGLAASANSMEPEDFLQELLPILAQAEREEEEKSMRTGAEKEMYDKICTAVDLFASMHRSTEKLRNLRPFKLKDEKEEECKRCGGAGMTVCSYCKGEGFVDLGENAEKFHAEFEDNILTLPKKVMGSIYHCPLCGGLKEERCVTCFGAGKVRMGGEEVGRYEAESSFDDGEIEAFDLDSLLQREKDRIEVGMDGTIVMRAKKVKRPGRKGNKEKGMVDVDHKKKRRGRPSKPRKGANLEEEGTVGNTADLSKLVAEVGNVKSARKRGPLRKIKARVGKTTDFVNTTDYKVGRRLAQGSGRREKKGLSASDEGDDTETPVG